MLKKTLTGVGILAAVMVLLGAVGAYFFQPDKHFILEFIRDHPEKSALQLLRNDTLIAEQNPHKVMPLASTVKIILAIEYAEQAASGIIDPDQGVTLEALDQFYVPNTDGGAHPEWLESVAEKVEDGQIAIREITKGMIEYSSNANTEWLSAKLGLEHINNRLDSLGVEDHTEIYYIVSALFVGKEMFPTLEGEALAEQLRAMSMTDYIAATRRIHRKLSTDTTYKQELGDLRMNIQRVWSDKLPASTAAEYAGILQKINSRSFFSAATHRYLDEVMEYLMEDPDNRAWLAWAGTKGGSTAFVLTKALYATDKQGYRTELAYFFNDLGIFENQRLQMSINEFELGILTDAAFRTAIEKELSK